MDSKIRTGKARVGPEFTPTHPMTFTSTIEPEPDLPPNALVAVNYGDNLRRLMVFAADGDGGFRPFNDSLFGGPKVVDDQRSYAEQMTNREVWRQPEGTIPSEPKWCDLLALGPVTVLFAAAQEVYQMGWGDGRRELVRQFEELCDHDFTAPAMPGTAPTRTASTPRVGDRLDGEAGGE